MPIKSRELSPVMGTLASGTSSSNFTMTDRAIKLVADNIEFVGSKKQGLAEEYGNDDDIPM